MMMRIDNGAVGLDDRLAVERKPIRARIGVEPAF